MRIHDMARVVGGLLVLGMVLMFSDATSAEDPQPAAHRVIACYFHRTNRCPTCRKISTYVEESLKTGFADEMKSGDVALRMIDFQDPKNERYTSGYKISGPTLVILDVQGEKVVAWKPAPKVWSLVGKKDAFLKYVQEEVRGYLEGK